MTPDLAQLLQDPARVRELPPEVARLAGLRGVVDWLGAPADLTAPRWALLLLGGLIVATALQGRRKVYRVPWWALAAGGVGLALWAVAGDGR